MNVLVTDCQLRNAVTIIRSLGKRGLTVFAGDSDRISTGFFSKYVSKRVVYPDIGEYETQFIEQLLSFIKKERIDIVFPISNEAVLTLAKHRSLFGEKVRIPITDYDTLEKASDKALTFRLAEKLGISMPRTFYPEALSDLDEVDCFPVILKPRLSSGSRGLALCHNLIELRKNYQERSEKYRGMIVQEYIPVDGYGSGEFCWYGVYDWDSVCKGYGCFKPLRSYPIRLGPSTVQESVEVEQINEISFKLLDYIRWKGLVQIDLRIDVRDRVPKLIEINARCWAPLRHSIKVGLDVPSLWLNLALGKSISKQPLIKTGIRTRWLLPGDILWFLSAKKDYKNIKEFFSFKGANYDLIEKSDMKPVFGFFLASFMYLFNKEKRQMIIRKNVRRSI